jgi:hypothetical protein
MAAQSLAGSRSLERAVGRPLVFQIAPDGRLWSVSESTYGHVGGLFCSLFAALAFARAEARAARGGASVVVRGSGPLSPAQSRIR